MAAGSGRRLASRTPKQFIPLGGRPMVIRALFALLKHPLVEGAAVALPRGFVVKMRRQIMEYEEVTKPIRLVMGGRERADSVEKALAVLPPSCTHVMVHDGVRPFVDQALIDRLLAELAHHDAVIPAIPAVDTLKEVSKDGYVIRTLDRQRVLAVQTPQAFDRSLLEEAFRKAGSCASGYTDCSGLVERCGSRIRVVEGSPENLKVTMSVDLLTAEQVLKEWECDA